MFTAAAFLMLWSNFVVGDPGNCTISGLPGIGPTTATCAECRRWCQSLDDCTGFTIDGVAVAAEWLWQPYFSCEGGQTDVTQPSQCNKISQTGELLQSSTEAAASCVEGCKGTVLSDQYCVVVFWDNRAILVNGFKDFFKLVGVDSLDLATFVQVQADLDGPPDIVSTLDLPQPISGRKLLQTVSATAEAYFSDDVLKNAGPVVVWFWAPWSGPCRMMRPNIDKLAADFAASIDVKMISDDYAGELVTTYNIHTYPTSVFFKQGVAKETVVSVVTYAALTAFVQRNLSITA